MVAAGFRFPAERHPPGGVSQKAHSQEPVMKKSHAIALTAVVALFGLTGAAAAQTVSSADPYEQGFAAGAAAKERNGFDAFDNGFKAGQIQSNSQTQSNAAQSFTQGYQAGMARADQDRQLAY